MVRLKGHFDGTSVLLDEPPPAQLVPGTVVEVLVNAENNETDIPLGSFVEELERLTGTVDGPPDLSEEHDHYAHGAPKRNQRDG